VHPDDVGGLQRGRDLMLGGGGDVAGAERRYLRSDGTELWVLQSTALVRGEDGQPRHFIAQVQDISQQREDERLKEEFVSVVTHELGTPLTSVAGYLDVVLEEDEDVPSLDPHHAHCVAVARRNTQRLIDLVEDLLLVRRLEAGREDLTRESLDLSALVEDRLESAEPMAGAKAIAVEGDIASGVIVDADPRRLAQVVDNLLSNAIKYTPDGGAVELALRVDRGLAELVVTDSGIGIPESEHAHLFNAFFRASNVSSGAVPGTGLGLVVTRRLIEAHGGTVGFDSAEDEGSRFVVTMPALSARAPAPAASAAAA
jgi:signal transduction histidine kinase